MFERDRPPRLPFVFQSVGRPLFFVTICTRRRASILANAAVHAAFTSFAERGFSQKQIAIGRYVIMPDHLHAFVCGPPEFVLAQWARMLKHVLGKAIRGVALL